MIHRNILPFDFQRPETEKVKFLVAGGLKSAGTGCIRNGFGTSSSSSQLRSLGGDDPNSDDEVADVAMFGKNVRCAICSTNN